MIKDKLIKDFECFNDYLVCPVDLEGVNKDHIMATMMYNFVCGTPFLKTRFVLCNLFTGLSRM